MIGAVVFNSDHIGWLPARLGVEVDVDQEVLVLSGPNDPRVEERGPIDMRVTNESMRFRIFVFPSDRLTDDERDSPHLIAVLTKLDPVPDSSDVDSFVS